MSGTCCGTASRSFEEIRSTSQGHGINKDVTAWNGFFYVKGRIGMPPGARLCPADLHISTESPSMLCSVNKGFAGVCVCVSLWVFFPPVYSAHGAVPKDCAHRISSADCWSGTYLWTGDLVFKLSRAEEPFPTLSGLL